MNVTTMKRSFTAAAIAIMALIIPTRWALAEGNKCNDVSADRSATAATTTGTITHGGILNGTTADLFTSSLMATPEPKTFSFTDTLAITSKRGGSLTDSDVTI